MEPHATRIVVWDTPAAVECGAALRFKVGVKCAAECGAAARRVEIRDEDGRSVASAAVGDVPWPGTAALYFAELELRAPDTEGLHAWEARAADGRRRAPGRHAHRGERAVPRSRRACARVSRESRRRRRARAARRCRARRSSFIRTARVTDAQGVAELRVPKGAYRLFVSGRDRFPFRSDGEVSADVTIRAELDEDRGPSDAELWS